MTAEEFLVDAYKQLKKDFDGAIKIIDELRDELEDKNEEISQYEALVAIFEKHLCVTKYGADFEFVNYKADEVPDFEFLKDYFDVDFVENDERSE